MPWTAKDAEGHTKKADTPKKQKTWAKIANSRLKTCLADDGEQDVCEASAIKVANSLIGNMNEQEPGGAEESIETSLKSAKLTEQEGMFSLKAVLQADKAEEAIREIREYTYSLQNLAWNIITSPEVEDKMMALRSLYDEFIELVSEKLEGFSEEAIQECELAESDVGSVIALHESESVDKDTPEPLQLDVVVIEPGWGNEKHNHYYSADMLKEYAHVFEGAKMYATNHKEKDKSVLTEVSQVLECPVSFTDTGAPVARVGIFDDDFATSIRNREALGMLDGLHVSILASGTAREYEENGRKGKYVESIAAGANVDWVTRAGAGGRALRLAENETEPDGGTAMTDQAKEKEKQEPTEEPTKEQPIKEAGTEEQPAKEPKPKPQPVLLSEADVETVLSVSKLPDVSRKRLAGEEYKDQDALVAAVAAEAEYVTALTGAGKPVGQDARPAEPKPVDSDKAYLAELAEIEKRFGVTLPYQQEGE